MPNSSRNVRFRIRDVYFPTPEEVLFALHGDDLLEGKVVGQSRGNDATTFVVVEVAGLPRPVFVPEANVEEGE